MAQQHKNKSTKEISVHAKASQFGSATSGKIVVQTKGFHKVISAVVFTSEQSKTLLEKIDELDRKYYFNECIK